MAIEKFVYATDLHYGFERKGGHKLPLHDMKAFSVLLQFIKDFQPDRVVLGGDMIDCGSISHHNHGKPGATEGLKLLQDVKETRKLILEPLEKAAPKAVREYITGNHEAWLDQMVERIPALEGIIELDNLLKLTDNGWKVIPQGGCVQLGKLVLIHGDQLSGGENCAKNAVMAFEKSVRFGHFHTHAAYSKTSCLDQKQAKTGIAVPCLCKKDPAYGKGRPNKWAQGFLYGYVDTKSGLFNDYVVMISDGTAMVNGKVYKG